MHAYHMIVMCGDVNPVVVSICNCTNHMSEGGKEIVTYIAEMFQDKVNKFDPNSRNTDVFFIDGTSNVQKAGLILYIMLSCQGACPATLLQ